MQTFFEVVTFVDFALLLLLLLRRIFFEDFTFGDVVTFHFMKISIFGDVATFHFLKILFCGFFFYSDVVTFHYFWRYFCFSDVHVTFVWRKIFFWRFLTFFKKMPFFSWSWFLEDVTLDAFFLNKLIFRRCYIRRLFSHEVNF